MCVRADGTRHALAQHSAKTFRERRPLNACAELDLRCIDQHEATAWLAVIDEIDDDVARPDLMR